MDLNTEELSKSKEKKTSLEQYNGMRVPVSNTQLRARFRSSLNQSKIQFLCHLKYFRDLKQGYIYNDEGDIVKDAEGKEISYNYVEVYSSEIKELLPSITNNLYKTLSEVATNMMSNVTLYADEREKSFTVQNTYQKVDYKNGKMTVYFNPAAVSYQEEIFKKNFAPVPVDIAFSFKTHGGFELYTYFYSYIYNLTSLKEMNVDIEQLKYPCYIQTLSINDLRAHLKLLNFNLPGARKELSKTRPDIDKIFLAEEEAGIGHKYEDFKDLRTRVLEPGIKEINEISDLYIDEDFETLKGAKGKILAVRFKIRRNRSFLLRSIEKKSKDNILYKKNDTEVIVEDNSDDIDTMEDRIIHIVTSVKNVKLTARDCKAILKAADNDMAKVDKAIMVFNNSNSDIIEPVAWIISAIQRDYDLPKENSKKKNGFNDFSNQREYDYENLEKILVAN